MDFPNLDLLESAAQKLRPLLPEIVFVGGCATGLLISDPGAAPVRRTYDVDVISEIVSYADYAAFSERLRALGFTEDSREGAPLCRWQHGELVLDVMPIAASILGFSNRWYADALRTAIEVELPSGLKLKAITAPYSLAPRLKRSEGAATRTTSQAVTWKTSSRLSMDARRCCKRLAKHHPIFARFLQRPCAAFCRRHGSSMHCRDIYQAMRRARLASCLSRRSSKR